jgi:hypothetical protein
MAVKSNQYKVSRVRARSSEARDLVVPIEHGAMSGLCPQKVAKSSSEAAGTTYEQTLGATDGCADSIGND